MKARIILFALVASIATTMVTAQNEQARMKQIREAYAGRLALMQDRPYDDGAPFNEVTTTVTNNLPGSGICTSNKHFYFTQPDFMESEDEEGEFDATLYSTLYYATSINVYAGTHHYIWEFLWDAETGDPMFAMLVMKEGSEKDSAQKEYRFYLDKGKVFKAVPDVALWPDPEQDFLAPYFRDLDTVPAIMAKQCAVLDALLDGVVVSNK